MINLDALLLALGALYALYVGNRFLVKPIRRRVYPPGPAALPIIGNVLDIPSLAPWLTYDKWAQQYGDIVHISAFGTHIIVLHSLDIISDLLEKRGLSYAGRPRVPLLGELVGWNESTILIEPGPAWRFHRRLFQQYFTANVALTYREIQIYESYNLLTKLLDSPTRFKQHIMHWMGAVVLEAVYGIKAKSENDEYIAVANAAVSDSNEAGVANRFLVDVFPILKHTPAWIPGAGFQVLANKWRERAILCFNAPFEAAKMAWNTGGAAPSFTSMALNELSGNGTMEAEEKEHWIKMAAASNFSAGAETTTTPLTTFFATMALYPDIQRKAQLELESVVGPETLPSLDDLDKLPYVQAIVKELLRWQPGIPLGVPHKLRTDDEYRGYHIPKDAIVFLEFMVNLA